ncbi:MAG: hypothetical protein WDN69_24185 [Aliidongia sp.]
MSTIALKIAQRAILAAAFVSTAAFAQPASHENILVTPQQENVWGARLDVPNQQQVRVTENVWGAQIELPAGQVFVARAPAPQAASADLAAQNAVVQGD